MVDAADLGDVTSSIVGDDVQDHPRDVFITGGTGYVGRRLAEALVPRRHRVRVLTRAASVGRVPAGVVAIVGNALDASSYVGQLRPGETLVHLVGTPHPSPSKAAEFQQVDRPSIEAAVSAATTAGAGHLVYVSIAFIGADHEGVHRGANVR